MSWVDKSEVNEVGSIESGPLSELTEFAHLWLIESIQLDRLGQVN